MPEAYPLAWPDGWPRTEPLRRQKWPNADRMTVPLALKELETELRLLGVKSVVLSSNCSLGVDKPRDPGVVAYGLYDGQQIAIPCDRWTTVPANIRAIAKTINAMRGMERWGVKHMIKAMFQGFTAIRGPGPKPWREALGFPADARPDRLAVLGRHAELAKRYHPDLPGGSTAIMAEINAARDVALAEVRGA